MKTLHGRLALALLAASLAPDVSAAERFYCDGNVTCSIERGCTGGDIPWPMNIWKEDGHWLVQDDLDGATPEIYTEIESPSLWKGALFLERVRADGHRQSVAMLTILPDKRMMLTWGVGGPWSSLDEYTLLSTCHEEE